MPGQASNTETMHMPIERVPSFSLISFFNRKYPKSKLAVIEKTVKSSGTPVSVAKASRLEQSQLHQLSQALKQQLLKEIPESQNEKSMNRNLSVGSP
ncbi:MAG: hypothetical protein QXZ70_07875 [Candidatus Bathyarchaeia archaeon]